MNLTKEQIEANRKFIATLAKVKPPVKKKIFNQKEPPKTITGKIREMFKTHKYCTAQQLFEKFGKTSTRALYELCRERFIVRLDHGLYCRNDKK